MGTRFFTPDTFKFLTELGANNERDWFKARKDRYEASVREPALAFIRAVGQQLDTVSSHFIASDKKVGGSLMRIYRDTRFGKDKRPYKTNIGIQFRHDVGKDVHAPGFYFHVEAEGNFLGVGMWRPENPVLNKVRAKIDEEQGRWKKIHAAKSFKDRFASHSEDALKRPPRGYDKDHPLVEDLKLRSHIVGTNLPTSEVTGTGLVDIVIDHFKAGSDYIRFLCEAVGVPY